MNEPIGTPMPEAPQKKTNVWLIVGIVAVVLFCCCCVLAGWLAWQYGDQVLYQLGVY